jgi:hypothetical protein
MTILGAVTAVVVYGFSILVFALRLLGAARAAHVAGMLFLSTAAPLVALLPLGAAEGRDPLYFIRIGLMLGFLVVTLLLDYWPRIDFRSDRRIVIPYVMLFFAGTGGMLGVVSYAGRAWMVAALVLYFAMAILAFVQRWRTGA